MKFRSNRLVAVAVLAFSTWQAAPAVMAQAAVKEVIVQSPSPTNANAEHRKEAVSYADLDLNSDAGAAVLVQRIKSAAKSVCAPEPTGLAEQTAYKSCLKTSVSHALARLNNAKVSALAATGE